MFANIKFNATTIIAVLIIAIGAVQTFMNANAGKPFDYFGCAMYVLGAVASYFIGTNPNGTPKTPVQVAKLNEEAKTTAVK
jgi:hypothetical protein